jgi:hypothetical protein
MSLLLDSPANTAKLDSEMRYWLPMLKDPVSGHRDGTFNLPMTYSQVATETMKFYNSFMDDLGAELLQKNADQLYPKGSGAAELLYLQRVERHTRRHRAEGRQRLGCIPRPEPPVRRSSPTMVT